MKNVTPSIELDKLCKSYADKDALNDVSLHIEPNEVLVLLGPNGSGKSTLLKLLATLFSCDKGVLSVFGLDSKLDKNEIKKKTGVLMDSIVHWDKLSGYENAWFFARTHGMSSSHAQNRIEDLFKKFQLWDDRNHPVSTYSYGMRRKLAIVEAMAHEPKLLLLDEPSMGLDYTSRLMLYSILNEEFNDSTIVLATNDVGEAKVMANRIVLLHKGKLLAADTPKNLINAVMDLNRIDIKLSTPIPIEILRNVPGVKYAEIDETENDSFKVQFLVRSEEEDALANIVNKVVKMDGKVKGIDVHEPNLEDVFMKYVNSS